MRIINPNEDNSLRAETKYIKGKAVPLLDICLAMLSFLFAETLKKNPKT